MKIKTITPVGKKSVYDLSVENAEHYVLENGVITHNTGLYYSADNIWIIGRRQEKDGTEVKGYHFIINEEKSRFVKEKSKIPISVSWTGGIEKYSGLLEIAVDGNFVHKGKKGRSTGYFHMDRTTGEVEEKAHYERETMNDEFWNRIIIDPAFDKYIISKFKIGAQTEIEKEEELIDEGE